MSTEEIYNYRRVNDRISTVGQPTEEQLRSAAAEGFTTVINLATFNPGHSVADEAGLVRSLDMMYHHIPVRGQGMGRVRLREVSARVRCPHRQILRAAGQIPG